MIKIEIKHDTEVYALLQRIADGLTHRQPLMKTLAETMKKAVDENFEVGGRPKWLGLKYREGMPLVDTGELRKSIQIYHDNERAIVGTDHEYAAIHHFGGRTRPHIIRARTTKSLNVNGQPYKEIHHPGSHIPARPFMQLVPEDEEQLVMDVQNYLRRLIDTA